MHIGSTSPLYFCCRLMLTYTVNPYIRRIWVCQNHPFVPPEIQAILKMPERHLAQLDAAMISGRFQLGCFAVLSGVINLNPLFGNFGVFLNS